MNTTVKVPPRERLSAERLRHRWSQLEVADQLGTTPGNVSRWERGITSPGPYFRSKLCELFGMSAHELGLTWAASEEYLAQSQILVGPGTTVALKEAQANHGRGCKSSEQMAIESASWCRDGFPAALLVKANTHEVGGEGLVMLMGGLNRLEQGQEGFVQAITNWLNISPNWVLVLDGVGGVRLVVETLTSSSKAR